jgi:hypothetical protein
LLLRPLFPAPLAQDIFIGSFSRLTAWHLNELGITLFVNCTKSESRLQVPPPPVVSVRCDDERLGAARPPRKSGN